VDRFLLYRAPVAFGEGLPAFAHGFPPGFALIDRRTLGSDTLEVYHRT
jgi:diaminohydroxyphosphoribosylaminopyrimidine deaminase/5-amino-6-(5-phosphoribosylamino)uracil reductase